MIASVSMISSWFYVVPLARRLLTRLFFFLVLLASPLAASRSGHTDSPHSPRTCQRSSLTCCCIGALHNRTSANIALGVVRDLPD